MSWERGRHAAKIACRMIVTWESQDETVEPYRRETCASYGACLSEVIKATLRCQRIQASCPTECQRFVDASRLTRRAGVAAHGSLGLGGWTW